MDNGATQTDITNTLRTRLEDPQLKVRNFGEEVNIVGQATVTELWESQESNHTASSKRACNKKSMDTSDTGEPISIKHFGWTPFYQCFDLQCRP